MTNERAAETGDGKRKPEKPRKFDLEERAAIFAERAIDFVVEIERNAITSPRISQLVRAATSIGANYREAYDAESKRDFRHKIGLCRKEARETKYWFRMIVRAAPHKKEEARPLWQEAKELHLIFSKTGRSSEQK